MSAPVSAAVEDIWVYLAASPLAGLTVTLIVYQTGQWVYRKSGNLAILNPVLIAVCLLGGLLHVTGTAYRVYFDGAQFVHFLLGPATVALAVPLYRQFAEVRRSAGALLAALIAGSLTAIVTAVGIGWVLDASQRTILSLAPKSVTTPIAMGIAEQLGGLPSLTAVLVILTGIIGAVAGPAVVRLLRISDQRILGFSLGVASHGIGTARALQASETAGAFAGLAMGLNGLATAILLPLLFLLFS